MRLVAKPRAEAGLIDDALRRREAGAIMVQTSAR